MNPAEAAPLTDAALTPYHAIKRALPLLTPGVAVIVIGVGGLGHMAVQLIRELASVHLIAADLDQAKLEQAKALGADDVVSTKHVNKAADGIREMTGPRGAALVLDCVGVQATFDLGARLVGRNSAWTIVGMGGGRHDFYPGSVPYECTVSVPYWGSRVELMEVIELARDGRLHAEVTEFPLEEAVEVYDKLKAGRIIGRAVLIPGRESKTVEPAMAAREGGHTR